MGPPSFDPCRLKHRRVLKSSRLKKKSPLSQTSRWKRGSRRRACVSTCTMIDVTSDDARQAPEFPSKAVTKASRSLQSLRGEKATKNIALQPMGVEEDLSTTHS